MSNRLPLKSQPIWRIFMLAWQLFCNSFSCVYPLAFIGAALIVGPFLLWLALSDHVRQTQIYQAEHVWFVQMAIAIFIIYSYLVIYKRMFVFISGERVWLPAIFINAFARLWRAYAGLMIEVMIVCFSFILFFPGFYFLVAYSFFFPLLILKNERSWPTLKRSFNLVQGHWWRTATVVIPPMLVLIGTGYMANFFTLVIWEAFGLSMNSVALPLTTLSLTVFLGSLFSPLYFAIILVQMQDLFCRRWEEAKTEVAYWDQKITENEAASNRSAPSKKPSSFGDLESSS
ncbi:MAG: hypothetical protein ACX932_02865 [Gammaproteobacteria bacterium]